MRNKQLLVAVGAVSLGTLLACSDGAEPAKGGPTTGFSATLDGGPSGEGTGEGTSAGAEPLPADDAGPTSEEPKVWTADNCLDGQSLDAADVDITHCPPIPDAPKSVKVEGKAVSLGAWEMGQTAAGDTWVYGSLTLKDDGTATLAFDGGTAEVNADNVACWGKAYYRLRAILQDPPKEWLALKNAGFQYRFFQFQTDLRNGATGYKQISSFQDHLVKWVSVINKSGVCEQPTLSKFRTYASKELTTRGLPQP